MSQRHNEPIVRDGAFRSAPLVAIVAFIVLALAAVGLLAANAPALRLPDLPLPAQAPVETQTPDLEAESPSEAPDCGGKPC